MKGTVRIHVNGVGAGTKVSMYIYQTLASGMTDAVYTNSEGDAYIDLDTDRFAEAEVYVGGQLRERRGGIKDTYFV